MINNGYDMVISRILVAMALSGYVAFGDNAIIGVSGKW